MYIPDFRIIENSGFLFPLFLLHELKSGSCLSMCSGISCKCLVAKTMLIILFVNQFENTSVLKAEQRAIALKVAYSARHHQDRLFYPKP